MNKAITDGIVFDPLPFSAGLALWSSGDGTPGSPSYAVSGSGVFVAADQDFSGCLEILKTDPTTKLRFMGEILRVGRLWQPDHRKSLVSRR